MYTLNKSGNCRSSDKHMFSDDRHRILIAIECRSRRNPGALITQTFDSMASYVTKIRCTLFSNADTIHLWPVFHYNDSPFFFLELL